MDELSQLAHQGGIGVMLVYGLQLLKSAKWFPWISQETGKLNAWLGLIVAFASSIGIKYLATAVNGGGYHVELDIPSAKVLLDALVHTAAQFAGQQILYNTSVKGQVMVEVPKA